MYFPIFLDIDKKSCVIIGGGKVAERKLKYLLEANAEITLIAPVATKSITKIAEQGCITWLKRQYRKGDISDAFLVISTTNDRSVNEKVWREAHENGVLANIADMPENCSFICPSIITRGQLTIAISTNGKSPAIAKKVREEIEKVIGPEYEQYLELAGALRKKVKNKTGTTENSQEIEKFLTSDVLALLSDNKFNEARHRMENCI